MTVATVSLLAQLAVQLVGLSGSVGVNTTSKRGFQAEA